MWEKSRCREKEQRTHHVVSLKDLTLVGSTIAVKRKSRSLLLGVFLGESDTGANGYLGVSA